MLNRLIVAVTLMVIGATAACTAPVGTGGDEQGPPDEEETEGKPKKPTDPATGEKSATTIDVVGADGRVDKAYSFDLTTKDTTNEKARKYRVGTGDLPAGITLAENGTLSGAPTSSGAKDLTIIGEGACGDASCRLEVRFSMKVANVILLSGFGPFDGVPVNPSWGAVEPLDEVMVNGYDVRVIQVPVIWDEAVVKYMAAYDKLRPSLALTSGVAVGEKGIRLETTARNFARGTDVANDPFPTGKIDANGATTLKTALPIELLKGALEVNKYPVLVSDNAGDFLCNYLFYKLMKRMEADKPANMIAGFVHVPGTETVSGAQMTEAWKLMLDRLTTHHRELVAKGVAANGASANEMLEARLPNIVHTAPKYTR